MRNSPYVRFLEENFSESDYSVTLAFGRIQCVFSGEAFFKSEGSGDFTEQESRN